MVLVRRVAALRITSSGQELAAAFEATCELCARFSPVVEPVHPQLVLVDLTGHRQVQAATLSASAAGSGAYVGIATNRWVALCVANYLAERVRDRWMEVPVGSEALFLAPLETRYLQAHALITDKTVDRLLSLGITTLGELAQVPSSNLTAQFGTRVGPTLLLLAKGNDLSPIRPLYPPDEAIARFQVAADNAGLMNLAVIDNVLLYLGAELATALTLRGRGARTLALEIQLQDRLLRTTRELKRPTWQQETLVRAARFLWQAARIQQPTLGLTLHGRNLGAVPVEQTGMFDQGVDEGLNLALQYVHSRFGSQSLCRAAQLPITRRQLVWELWERERL